MGTTSCCQKEPHPLQDIIKAHPPYPESHPDLELEAEAAQSPCPTPANQCRSSCDKGSDTPKATEESGHSPRHLSEDGLVRGIRLKATLWHLGSLWRKSPCDMELPERTGLWQKSRPLFKFDKFISHTWATPGRSKVVALLLQTGWGVSASSWALAVLVSGILCALNVLPMPFVYHAHFHDFHQECPFGMWIMSCSSLAQLVGLLASPYLCSSSPDCFLDVVSINQCQPELTERGVYGLGSFLSISKELHVLWSPPYLTRLWCVFELAAFRAANPVGRIRLSPLYVELVIAAMLPCMFLVCTVFWIFAGMTGGHLIFPAEYCLCAPVLFYIVHVMRRYHLQKHVLFGDLKHFSLEQAECRLDSDRALVLAAIKYWYESEQQFTEYVRGKLHDELSAHCCTKVPINYLLWLILPVMSLTLEQLLAYWKGGAPVECLVAFALRSLALYLLWSVMILRFGLYLSDRLARPLVQGKGWNALQSCLVGSLWLFMYFAGVLSEEWAHSLGVAWTCGWSALVAVLFGVFVLQELNEQFHALQMVECAGI
ncbi:unnamed protein product [Effrenium voratum]|uniref:Uncharacterized protein n=1 Tax=Effrenium voratum TaxID=2562239 RepID=A0AA36N0F3_9DINO|nr:unnamed protein product [Effrenium voratum]CAJ1438030.1 unnamed protein product [Effrenium voratum]